MPTLLSFPDAATLRRVIADRVIPEDIAGAPVLVDPDNSLNLAVESPFSRTTSKLLGEMEVGRSGRNRLPDWAEADSWYHAAPLDPHRHGSVGDVLLKLPAGKAAAWLPKLGGEISRLNIRLSGDSVFIRDSQCPRHQFERASDGEDGAKAFVEQASGVWVEAGKRHPFVERLACPPGEMTLIEEGRLPYVEKQGSEFPEFATRLSRPTYRSAKPPEEFKIKPRLKLSPDTGPGVDPALWIVPTGELAEMVTELPPHALETMDIIDLGEISLVRAGPKSQSGYWLPGHYPAWSLLRGSRDVYLPLGWKIEPQIRRSVLLDVLGHRHGLVTWVSPGKDDEFSVNSTNNSFVPLAEKVEHIPPAGSPVDAVPITNPFPFSQFVCEEFPTEVPARRKTQLVDVPIAAKSKAPVVEVAHPAKIRLPRRRRTAELEVSEAEIERRKLVDRFLAVEGPLDHPDRVALWPLLAEVHQDLDTQSSSVEASKCWIESIWHEVASDDEVAGWAESAQPGFVDIARAVGTKIPATELKSVIDRIEAAEAVLPIKGVWLAAKALYASSGDVLGLARVRDRLLLRMHERGVISETDAPAFIRQKSSVGSGSTSGVSKLENSAMKWLDGCPTAARYVRLIFNYGKIRTGESRFVEPVPESTTEKTAVGMFTDFMTKAYQYRIGQAMLGSPPQGCLADSVLSLPGGPDYKPTKDVTAANLQNAEYMINKFRGLSRIVEPQMRTDPLSVALRKTGPDLRKELAAVIESENGREIEVFARKKLKSCSGRDLHNCIEQLLPVCVRTTESLAAELVEAACRAVPIPFVDKVSSENGVADARQFGRIASRGIRAAGHFGLDGAANKLAGRLLEAIQTARQKERVWLIAEGIGGSVREFHKLGRLKLLELLVSKTERLIGNDPESHPALSAIASAKLVCGDLPGGRALLDEIGGHLFSGKSGNKLLCWTTANLYCSAAGHLPDAIERYEQLLSKLHPSQIGELRGLESQYCPERHLVVLETMVLSIVENNGVFGKELQNWFDQEEFLVRQRIHADMAAARAAFGA